MIDLALHHFEPIGLDAMVEHAELLTRVDRKYLLTPEQTHELLDDLDASTRALEIDGRRQASYESVYFDTPDLVTYRMCVQQRRRRVKIRTRSYLDTGIAFLEAKTRREESTVKERIGHAWRLRDRLDPVARAYAADALLSVGQDPCLAASLESTISTRYRRATLLAPEGGSRITLDTDLTWELPDGEQLVADDLVILETKSAGSATAVDRLLWHRGQRPTSISKFATGLAAMRPALPHNRWARVLRDQFTPYSKELACTAV